MTKTTIGIDVSKDSLDLHSLPDGACRQFTNDQAGHKALIEWLNSSPVERIVFEPTGPYHRKLERGLAECGLPYAKINPRQARRFAEATGKLVKTDRADAMMLARFGALLRPEESQSKRQSVENLSELVAARRALVKDRTAARNRLHNVASPLLHRQIRQRLKQIEAHIKAIDAECRKQVETDPELRQRRDILITIPGLGDVTVLTLLADMPELGAMDKRQTAALAGLAPITRQSGTWKGKSFIRGGRATLRQALYMPTLVAIRFNPDLKAKYTRLIAAGKPAKVAITAIMRTLITVANALIRDNRKWSKTAA